MEHGVLERNIFFFNVVACPEGVDALLSAYPSVTVITGHVDAGLNEKVMIALFSIACCTITGPCRLTLYRDWGTSGIDSLELINKEV